MPRVIITALLLLIALAYAVLFTTWNMEPVKVVGWRMGSQELWESIPLAYLVLAGVALGVIAMIIATLCAWLGQRAQIKKMRGQIQRAKEVLEQQRKRIEELEAALAQANEEIQALRQPPALAEQPPIEVRVDDVEPPSIEPVVEAGQIPAEPDSTPQQPSEVGGGQDEDDDEII